MSASICCRVPQCLLYLGVLEYSDELMGKLRRWEHLEPGSPDEVEIRGCSVWAVEVKRNSCIPCLYRFIASLASLPGQLALHAV